MWLKIIAILIILKNYSGFELPRKCLCDLKMNNVRYNVSEVYHVGDEAVYPTDAHFDVRGNLFYVETCRVPDGYKFNINVIRINTTTPQRISGLPEGLSYSIAIDKKLSKVYFGTEEGMYVYNYETQTASPLSNSTSKLDMIFVDKNSNKYTVENNNGIYEFYILDGDKKILCHSLEALNVMAIDEQNNFYFIREDKLFVVKSTHSDPMFIGNVTYNGIAQISFHNNTVFVASDTLSYFHENDTGLKLVENIPGNVTAIAFDSSGNFVVGLQGKILKYNKNDCYFRKGRVVDDYE